LCNEFEDLARPYDTNGIAEVDHRKSNPRR